MNKESSHEVMTPSARLYKIVADLNARICELEHKEKERQLKDDKDIDVPPMSPGSGYGMFDR